MGYRRDPDPPRRTPASAEIRRLAYPDDGRMEAAYDPLRRCRRPSRGTQPAARPGPPDPRKRPARPIPAGRGAHRRTPAPLHHRTLALTLQVIMIFLNAFSSTPYHY